MAGSSGLRNGLVSSSSCNVLGIVGIPCTSIRNVHLCCMLTCMTLAISFTPNMTHQMSTVIPTDYCYTNRVLSYQMGVGQQHIEDTSSTARHAGHGLSGNIFPEFDACLRQDHERQGPTCLRRSLIRAARF